MLPRVGDRALLTDCSLTHFTIQTECMAKRVRIREARKLDWSPLPRGHRGVEHTVQ